MGSSFEHAPAPTSEPERRALPCELGRFVLLRELGAGGMATVYLGKMRLAEGLERLVAVKLIHDELADQSAFVDMFLDEARIASLITHPNVCGVHDFGHADGTYFLAMEYLVGEPVSEIIREVWEQRHDEAVMGALPYLAARIVADACEGLHAAHETRGADGRWLEVVHRDVSPQNLFVTYEGAVKVVDFGCAKALQRITETNAGIFKGKVAYAAPEQLKIEKLDARTDVWALGAVLWEALTLERVFKRDTPMQTARAILEEEIPRVDEINPGVPPELADIVERALTRDKGHRFQSARELGRALRTFIAGGGASFESAELAEWMDFLFAGRRTRLLRMVEEVERSLASHVALSPGALLDSGTHPEAQPPTLEQPLDEDSDPGEYAAPRPRRPAGLGPATRMAASHAPLVRESGREVLEDEPTTVATASSPGLEPAPRASRPPTRGLRLDAADRVGSPARRSRGSLFWALLAAAIIVVGALGVGVVLAWPEPPPSRSGGDHGTVIVEAATGSADVYRDGQHMGRTPLTLQLPGGPQRLVLRGFGRGVSEEVVVPVTPGTTSRITVRPR